MKDMMIASNAAAELPEEVISLMGQIEDVCDDQTCGHIISALWLSLLAVLIATHECTPEEAIEHVLELAMGPVISGPPFG